LKITEDDDSIGDADQSSHRGKSACKNLFTRKESAQIIEALFELLRQPLEEGDDVLINGFGKFCVREKSRRRGRNPQSGEPITAARRW
jgi:integration host factor subunit alpha